MVRATIPAANVESFYSIASKDQIHQIIIAKFSVFWV